MTLEEIEAEVKAGRLSMAEAFALAGGSAQPKVYPTVCKRNRSGGIYISHPGLGDKFGFNLTSRQADFIMSDVFQSEIVPLMRALPPGCAEPKNK